MIVFIDESGDSGFKKSSSKFFSLTMIVVHEEEICKIDDRIEKLKQKYHIFPEYKFSKTSDSYKATFFNEITDLNFFVRSIVVEKELLYSSELRGNPKKFYNFFLKQLLQHSSLTEKAKVRLDKSSSKIFQKQATTYIHRQLQELKLQIKYVDSKSNNLIQLADMVCGAICRKYANPTKKQFLHQITNKIEDIWAFH